MDGHRRPARVAPARLTCGASTPTTPCRTSAGCGSVPNSALSAASCSDGPSNVPDRRLALQERHVDPADLVVAELEVADAVAVVRCESLVAADRGDDARRPTTAAWPSANTPAFGVPTLVTSPTAYTPGKRVSSVSGSTGIQPSTVIPDSATTAGAPVHRARRGTGRRASRRRRLSRATLRVRVERRAPACSGCHSMPRSANAASSAADAAGDGGIGDRQRHHQRDLGPLAQPALDQVVVHQQRRLARRRRALERRRA